MDGKRSRRAILRDTGKAVAVYHLALWTGILVAPVPAPSAWAEILLAPTLALVFAALALVGSPDTLDLLGWAIALACLVAAVRLRHRRASWVLVLTALLALGATGVRLAIQSASA